MSERDTKFGFYPYRQAFDCGDVELLIVSDFDEIIGDGRDNRVWNGWYYPPLEYRRKRGKPIDPLTGPDETLLYADSFTLPNTHILRHHASLSKQRANFLIVTFGCLVGMRTIPDGWQHLARTPIRRQEMSDLVLRKTDIEVLIAAFDRFFEQYSLKTLRAFHSAIHAYQWAAITEHWFERFSYLCMALDAIATVYTDVYGSGWHSRSHAKGMKQQWSYARDLCAYLKIPSPFWARKHRGANKCTLSILRNSNFHDAQIQNQPVGLVLNHAFWDMMLELQNLVLRAIIFVSGVKCGYTSSALGTRQMYGLDRS